MKRVMVQHKNIIFAFIGTAILYGFIMFFFNFYFDINDDVTIKNILNGSFSGTPDAHAVYIQYPLAFIISALYRIFPAIPWYGLLINGCQAFCIAIIIYYLQIDCPYPIFSIAVSILSIFSLVLSNLVFTQYTVTAALLAGTAIILLSLSGKSKIKRPLGIFLYLLSFCVREEVFLLSLPFFCFVIFAKVVITKTYNKETIYEYAKTFALLLGSCILIALIHKLAFVGNDWKNYTEFNDVRTKIYDYQGLPSYEGNPQIYESAGLSEADYYSLFYYNIIPNSRITTEKLAALSTETAKLNTDTLRSKLGQAYIQYKYRSTHSQDYPFNLFVGILYLSWIICIFASKKWLDLLLPFLSLAMRSAIWMCIIFMGRYPERITDSLYIIEVLMLLCVITISLRQLSLKHRNILTICLLLLVGSYGIINVNKEFNFVSEKNKKYEAVQSEYIQIFNYMKSKPDSSFLLDVYSFVSYTELMNNNEYAYQNYELMGGWLAQSPLSISRLNTNNQSINNYIVSKSNISISWLENLGMDLTYYEQVGEFSIWRIE